MHVKSLKESAFPTTRSVLCQSDGQELCLQISPNLIGTQLQSVTSNHNVHDSDLKLADNDTHVCNGLEQSVVALTLCNYMQISWQFVNVLAMWKCFGSE